MKRADLFPAEGGMCYATPPGREWPWCARPADNHAGKHGRHESHNYMWNDRGWFELKPAPSILRKVIASWTPAQRAGIRHDIEVNMRQITDQPDKLAILQQKLDLIDGLEE